MAREAKHDKEPMEAAVQWNFDLPGKVNKIHWKPAAWLKLLLIPLEKAN